MSKRYGFSVVRWAYSLLGDYSMRISLKITFAITLWTLMVLVGHANLRLNHELALIQSDLERDARLIGRALLPAVTHALEVEGEDGAQRLLSEAVASEQEVRIRWVRPDDHDARADGVWHDGAIRAAVSGGREIVRAWPPQAPSHLITLIPVPGASTASALELTQSLSPRDAFADRSMRELAINLLVIGSVSAAMAVALGWWLVGKRVRILVGFARTIGGGAFPPPLRSRRRDELGELTVELSGMGELLRQAKLEAQHRETERDRLTLQLRHADRLATVGSLLSRVAHEVGTPLNVIAARAKLIARRQVEGDAAVDNATIVAEQADVIAATIRRMLDFARKGHPTPQSTDLASIADDTVALLQTLADDAGVDLGVEPATTVPRVAIDRVQVQQALANIIVNGIQATPEGGRVTVHVEQVVPSGDDGGSAARIVVADTGPGIAPDDLPRVFEPFFTTKAAGEGTGLGLSVSADIVREQGGRIEIETGASGTRVAVVLPRE